MYICSSVAPREFEDFMHHVLECGAHKGDRTGTSKRTRSSRGPQMRVDPSPGFARATTTAAQLKSIIQELPRLLRGDSKVKSLQERGDTVWDEWPRENSRRGPVYSVQISMGPGTHPTLH